MVLFLASICFNLGPLARNAPARQPSSGTFPIIFIRKRKGFPSRNTRQAVECWLAEP